MYIKKTVFINFIRTQSVDVLALERKNIETMLVETLILKVAKNGSERIYGGNMQARLAD